MTVDSVVLVVLDSFRADALDLAEDGATPHLARLARRGMRFEGAVAPAAWTLPSLFSMMTGLAPTEHKIHAMGSSKAAIENARTRVGPVDARREILPSFLRASGVRTWLGSTNVWTSRATGFGDLFDELTYVPFPPGRRRDRGAVRDRFNPNVPHLPGRLRRATPLMVKHAGRVSLEAIGRARRAVTGARPLGAWALSRSDKGGERIVDAFCDRLTASKFPFFALLHLIETHEPHLVPRGYGQTDYRSVASLLLRPGASWVNRVNRHNWGYKAIPSSAITRLRVAYDAEVQYSDSCVGRVVAGLRRAGLEDRTAVIVTADHGEALGEQRLVGHGLSLGDSVLRVPLIVAAPGIAAEVVEDPVSLTGVAATIAELLSPEEHPFTTPSVLSSESRGHAHAEVEAPWNHFHSLGFRMRVPPVGMESPAAAFYEGHMKLVVGSFWGRALYDLEKDPAEKTNLVGELPCPPGLEEMEMNWARRAGVPNP